MIYEIASLCVDPTRARDFESAVGHARPHFESASGFISFCLQREIEDPSRYRLVIGWDSVEAHMITFRASQGFQEWRNLVGPFFIEAPVVVHTDVVIW